MTIKEYAPLAQMTASTNTPEDKRGHGMMGLISEAGEVMDVIKKQRYMGLIPEIVSQKLEDEIGDILWYVVEYCEGADIDIKSILVDAKTNRTNWKKYMPEYAEMDAANVALSISVSAVRLMQLKVSLDSDVRRCALVEIIDGCIWLLDHINVTLEDCLEENIRKLRLRYGDKFSAKKSNARYTTRGLHE